MVPRSGEPRTQELYMMTCMPLIRRAYEADGGHIYHTA